MMIRNLALAAMLMVSISAAPAAQAGPAAAAPKADPYEATITKIVRVVEWQRSRTTRWQKASIDNLLMVGDTIRTGVDAKTELQYGDGSVTRVGSLTSLTLTGENKRELRLDSGKVWLHIQKGGAGMRVITPGAVAAVTGTELMVEFDPAKKVTEVTVFEGSVNVISDVGNLVRVLGGTTTMVPFQAPAAAPVPLDTRKMQERENIFRPLSVKDSGDGKSGQTQPESGATQPKQSEGKSSETKQSETKQSETKQSETKQSETKQSETKQSETKQSETKQSETKGQDSEGKHHTAPADPSATTPDNPVTPDANGAKQDPGTATQPDAGKTAGTGIDTDKKAITPDFQDQTKKMLDPRTINGSPTTGTVRVIIE